MILTVPGVCGLREEAEFSAEHLSERFWASLWGLRALQEGQDPTAALLAYLTASRNHGGLEASWTDRAGLRTLRDHTVNTRPEGPP